MKNLICVPCDQCGKDVWKKKWDAEHYKNHFCSKECFSNFRKVGQTIQCCNCGKEIYRNEMEIVKSKSGPPLNSVVGLFYLEGEKLNARTN